MTAERPRISVVIVNYRTYDLLAACITALLSSRQLPNEIVVVDNASDTAHLAAVAARFPAVRTIANADNPGFAVACNQGWRQAAGDFVLFLNPDVTIEPNTLEVCLREAASAASIGVVTCRLVRPDGSFDHACHRGLPTPSASLAYALRLHRLFPRSRILARYTMSWLDLTSVHDIEACSGAFMLVRRSALETAGGWDERYWFYAEDLDLCLRMARLGYRVRYVGTAVAVHVKGASSHLREPDSGLSRAERTHKRRVQRAIIESHAQFFKEHYEKTTPRPMAALIKGMFAVQRLRSAVATGLDSRRAR